MQNPKFQIYKSGSEFRYRLLAANGENILYGEGYTTKQSCVNGIASVKINAPYDIRYDRKDGITTFSFNLKGGNGEIIGRSQSYSSKQAREVGVSAVKKDAPNAPTEDLT